MTAVYKHAALVDHAITLLVIRLRMHAYAAQTISVVAGVL